MSATAPPWINAEEVFGRVDFAAAIRAVQRELRAGLDPAADFDRSVLPVEAGQLLLMPSRSSEFVGVKIASVAPGNPELGRERIQAVYLLMDAASLSPIALLDGTALTTLRTPAVSAAAVDYLAADSIGHLVVFGSGPQARGHIQALSAIRSLNRITIVGRNLDRAAALAADARAMGLPAVLGGSDDVQDAQLVVCATTAREPLFDGALVPQECCVVAVGSHEPEARELDSALIGRCQVVVEDPAAARREAGDVIVPIAEGVLTASALVPLRDIVAGVASVDFSRPRVFKSSGMSWEDLVVAAEVYRAG
ncbi:MAG: ornithine cyclodeaminase family protein [Microbacteriaceae bacterium]